MDSTPANIGYLFKGMQIIVPSEGDLVLRKLKDLKICFDQNGGGGGAGEFHYGTNDSAVASAQLLSVLRNRTGAGVQKLTVLTVPECAYDRKLDAFAETVKVTDCEMCRYPEEYGEYGASLGSDSDSDGFSYGPY